MYYLKEIPVLDSGGYFLETANKGWLSVIKPVRKANLITNPDMTEIQGYYTPFPQVGTSAFLTQGTAGIGFPSSIIVTPSTDVAQINLGTTVQLTGEYTFSAYVKSVSGATTVDIAFAFGRTVTYDITEEYTRISITNDLPNALYSLFLRSDVAFETTAWQLEEGTLSTYISGNLSGGYIWEALANDSISWRLDTEYTGGEEVSLYEYGFKVTAISGMGSPQMEPIVQDIALSYNDLYLCSIPEQREIEITGIILACDFEDFTCKHGGLVSSLINTSSPVRMCFHPYVLEDCEITVPDCMCFDFLYTDGLGEAITSLFNQELTIEGVGLSHCLNSCIGNDFVTVHTDDFVTNVTGGAESVQMILDTGETVDANITTQPHSLIDVVSYNGSVYASVLENNGTGGFFPIDYNVYCRNIGSDDWELIFSSDTEAIHSLELAEGKLYVGGQFTSADVTIPNAANVVDATMNALWVLDIGANSWNNVNDSFDITHATNVGNVGIVFDIKYDPVTRVITVGGFFTDVNAVNSTNVYGINLGGTDNTNTVDFGTTSGQVFALSSSLNGIIWAGGTYVNTVGGDGNPSATVRQNIFGRYGAADTSQASPNLQTIVEDSPYPFLYNGNNFEGEVSDIYYYNGYVFLGGEFDMATSHHNDPLINTGSQNFIQRAYLGNIGWVNQTRINESRGVFAGSRFGGAILPLSATMLTTDTATATSVAYGVFPFNTAWDTTPPATTPTTELNFRHMDTIDGSLIISADNLAAYGTSTNPMDAGGFAEFVFPSGGTPSQGSFIQPSFYSETGNGRFFSVDVPGVIGMYSNGFGSTDLDITIDSDITYNSGIYIEQCTNFIDTDVELFINGDLVGVSGVVNVDTGRRVLFNPIDISGSAVITYTEQTINITANGVTYTPVTTLNEGNPLTLAGNDRIKVLFNLNEQNDATISAKYTPCYISWSELCACEV